MRSRANVAVQVYEVRREGLHPREKIMTIRIHHLAMYLIVSILSPLADGDFLDLRNKLNGQVQASRSQAVVMDVTGLDVMDSFACRALSDISRMMKARGTETAIIGIHPEIEESMERFGLKLEHATVATNLEEGLAVLGRRIATKRHASKYLPPRGQDSGEF